ncbi:tyrosine-type recombinase/integrase [Grylomicrobium aquisgranensis]|uniref:tyrosine-type recombinase/integrase n=1 Tax=Grylomicrobium aquisgranensis TaxID=2926318 RepID=UPI00352FF82D
MQGNAGIEKSGVQKIRMYDLRHSHATWLINHGVNIVAVSKRLGHASIEQTLKTYTHLLESTDNEMMKIINSEKKGSTMVPR